MAKILKSIAYFIGFTGLGYGLLVALSSNSESTANISPQSRNPDTLKEKRTTLDVLRYAAENKKPMYRQTKQEIEEDMKRAQQK